MDVHELKNIIAEYGKIKSLKVIHHQNGGTENRAMICYETEMEAQREDKERTNTSSREIETEENDSEKTNQSGIKDERTCYACGTKGNKIKDCESKLNIFITFKENLSTEELKIIMEEYGNCKKHQNKRSTNRIENTANGLFLKGNRSTRRYYRNKRV